jgi:hypothetical protein
VLKTEDNWRQFASATAAEATEAERIKNEILKGFLKIDISFLSHFLD